MQIPCFLPGLNDVSERFVRDMTTWTDKQLVEACLKDNEQAWSVLIDRYKTLIFCIPIKAGLSREDAADIFQQVCLKLLAELPKIRDPGALGAWLIKVTSYDSFRLAKRERMRTRSAAEPEREPTADASDQPAASLLQLEREQILRETLQQISPRCRELVHMLFYESPSVPYEEVAHRLRLARGSVGFIRMRCLKQLRMRLIEKGFQ